MINSRMIIGLLTFLSLLITNKAIALPKNSSTFNYQFLSASSINSCDESLLSDSIRKEQDKDQQENIITESTVSPKGITVPSLWWAREQFDPFNGRLVEKWLAYPQLKQINLIVNWQLWTLLDYLGRYRFVNQFGTVARNYGYSLNIINQNQQCLATYKQNLNQNSPKWEINLEKLGQDSLQVEQPEN